MANKSYNLTFEDEREDGWISVTPSGISSNLIAFKIPRDQLDSHNDKKELANSGIYILCGRDENGNDEAYIGQVSKRENGQSFRARFSDPDHVAQTFWKEAIVFTTTTTDAFHTYDSTALDYLEALFIYEAFAAKKYKMDNKKRKPPESINLNPNLKTPYDSDFETARYLVYALGHDIFVKEKYSYDEKTTLSRQDGNMEKGELIHSKEVAKKKKKYATENATKPTSFTIENKEFVVEHYKDVIINIMSYLAEKDPNKMNELAENDTPCSTKENGVPFISYEREKLTESRDIHELNINGKTIYYITGMNKNNMDRFIDMLLQKFDIDKSKYNLKIEKKNK